MCDSRINLNYIPSYDSRRTKLGYQSQRGQSYCLFDGNVVLSTEDSHEGSSVRLRLAINYQRLDDS